MAGKRKKAARRRALWTSAAGVAALMAAPAAYAQEQTHRFDIPSQPLSDALLQLGDQARLSIAAPSTHINGRTAPAVAGEMSAREALTRLLVGTGLRFEFIAPNAVRVVSDDAAALSRGDQRAALSASSEEIVVIGTNLRGAPPGAAPVDVYTSEDIERSSATTIEQFVARLPQNMGTRTQFSATATSTPNREAVSAVDLRGLGVGTTLTLLNGRRMALANFGQAADVSLIPVSAVREVQVLTDGASAIYGSDAIGGVVNFVLRDDFDGAETRFSYGETTSGGLRQGSVSQTFGRAWGSGNGLISLDIGSTSALSARDRDYASAARGDLTPTVHRHSVVATVGQDVGDRLRLDGALAVSQREVKQLADTGTLWANGQPFWSSSQFSFGNVGANYQLSEALELSGVLTYSAMDTESRSLQNPGAAGVLPYVFNTEYSAWDFTAMMRGDLLRLPAGPVRFSFGGGYLTEQYEGSTVNTGSALSGRDLGRTTTSAFGEVLIPLVGAANALPFVRRLEFNLAARYTSYEDDSSPSLTTDFGDRISPKVGLVWAPSDTLTFRGTFGESFRAPALTQVDPTSSTSVMQQNIQIGGVASTMIAMSGPAPTIEAETADTYTLGFDYRPGWARGFRLSGTYFNIDYSDRIAMPSVIPARRDPPAWPELIQRPDSPAAIEEIIRALPNGFNNTGVNLSDPAAAAAALYARTPNIWIIDARTRNLSLSQVDGFDLSFSNVIRTDFGDITLGAQFTKIFEYLEQATPSSPVISVVDTVMRPADLRGRAYVSIDAGRFSGTLGVNYVDSYQNPLAPVGGSQEVEDWTTFDLALTYHLAQSAERGRGVRLSFSAQNIFDEDPPRVTNASGGSPSLDRSPGFDPANANPLGTVLSAGLIVAW